MRRLPGALMSSLRFAPWRHDERCAFVHSRRFCADAATLAVSPATASCPSTSEPPAGDTASASSGSAQRKVVVNVLDGKPMQSDGTRMRSLRRVGFGERGGLLVVEDPAKLTLFAKLLREGKLVMPSEWRHQLKVEVGAILLCSDIADPAGAVQGLLEKATTAYMERQGAAAQGTASVAVRRTKRSEVGSIGTDDQESAEMEQVILNEEQRGAVELALSGRNIYIGGQAGTGKTVVLRAIRHALKKTGLLVAMTATTGIAGCHINGSTFHSAFGLDVHGNFQSTSKLKKFDVIIIDEISMMSGELLMKLDQVLRLAIGNPAPFAGIQLILCGDFLQLSAFGNASTPMFSLGLFQKNFLMVKLTTQLRQNRALQFYQQLSQLRLGVCPADLHETISSLPDAKAITDAVFLIPKNKDVEERNAAELAALPGDPFNFDVQKKPPQLTGDWSCSVLLHTSPAFDEFVFRGSLLQLLNERTQVMNNEVSFYRIAKDGFVLRLQLPPPTEAARRLALESAFEDSLKDLSRILDEGSRILRVSKDNASTIVEEDDAILTKQIEALPVAKSLQLKVGARVMLRANLSPRFVNGSIGVVVGVAPCRIESLPLFLRARDKKLADVDTIGSLLTAYHDFLRNECGHAIPTIPIVRFGESESEEFAIPPWRFSVGGTEITNFWEQSAVCIPLSLAYAFTVHKVQGLTIHGRVHLSLEDAFRCNHLMYVAMSRVKNPTQLSISGFTPDLVQADPAAVAFDETVQPVSKVAANTLARLPIAMWKEKGSEGRQSARSSGLDRLVARRAEHKQLQNRISQLRREGAGQGEAAAVDTTAPPQPFAEL